MGIDGMMRAAARRLRALAIGVAIAPVLGFAAPPEEPDLTRLRFGSTTLYTENDLYLGGSISLAFHY